MALLPKGSHSCLAVAFLLSRKFCPCYLRSLMESNGALHVKVGFFRCLVLLHHPLLLSLLYKEERQDPYPKAPIPSI